MSRAGREPQQRPTWHIIPGERLEDWASFSVAQLPGLLVQAQCPPMQVLLHRLKTCRVAGGTQGKAGPPAEYQLAIAGEPPARAVLRCHSPLVFPPSRPSAVSVNCEAPRADGKHTGDRQVSMYMTPQECCLRPVDGPVP